MNVAVNNTNHPTLESNAGTMVTVSKTVTDTITNTKYIKIQKHYRANKAALYPDAIPYADSGGI